MSGAESGSAAPDGGGYLLGDRREELERLGAQHHAWAEQAHRAWRRAGFGEGQRLLDLGSGPGFASLDLAHLVGPEGKVVSVDSSRDALAYLRVQAESQGLSWVDTVEADATSFDASLGGATFDGAYSRWLMCFLADPGAAVEAAARVLAPGAPFLITDYFNYRAFTFGPRQPALDRVAAAVEERWRASGGNLEVQGEMPRLLREAGFHRIEITCTAPVVRPGSPLWAWPRNFFSAFLPTLVEDGFLTPGEARAFEQTWDRLAEHPDAFLCPPPLFDVLGFRKETR